jgi:hypothetical protein
MWPTLSLSSQDIWAIVGVVVVAVPEIGVLLERNDGLLTEAEGVLSEIPKYLYDSRLMDLMPAWVFLQFIRVRSLAHDVDNAASVSTLFGYGNVVSAIVVAVAVFLPWMGLEIPEQVVPVSFSSSILLFFASLVVNRFASVRGRELTRSWRELRGHIERIGSQAPKQ